MPFIFIGLAKSTTPATLLLAESLGPSLSPHEPALVAVTSVLEDVYSTVMRWLTSDQPRASRPTWKRKCWSIYDAGLSHEPRTDQFDPIPSADGDSCRWGRFFIVTDHVNGHEEKSNGQGDILGRVCRFCSLENIERVLWSQQEDVRQSLQRRSISGLSSIYGRLGPELGKGAH